MISSLKKYICGSFIVHVSVIVLATAAFFLKGGSAPSSHELVLSEMDGIESVMTEEELINSVAVSEAELQESLDRYEEMASAHQSELLSEQKKVDSINKQIKSKEAEISKRNNELRSIESRIKKMEEAERKLKQQRDADAKKKRIERERIEKEKAQKAKKQAEQAKELARKKRLEEQRSANEKALARIAAQNKAAEERELALIRGRYERDIHNLLYNAWTLPFDRTDVHCTVELTLSSQGYIEGFVFKNPCPSNYKQMIDLAIEDVSRLPRVGTKIFRKREIVNFIDRVE